MANFDPYHQWLGISPAEQPPDHYRLLGIPRFEDDPIVIENAADRQMIHLKNFQSGMHSADSQRLLNEVSSARICLLSADKKAAYDEQLRQTASNAVAPQVEIFLQTDRSTAVVDEDDAQEAIHAIEVADRIPRRKSCMRRHLPVACALLVASAFVFVLLGISVPENKMNCVAVSGPVPPTEMEAAPAAGSTPEPEATPETDPTSDPTTSLEPVPIPGPMMEPEAESEPGPILSPILEPESTPAPEPEPILEPETTPAPEPEPTPEPETTPKSESTSDPVGANSKQPVPPTADRKKIEKKVEEAYSIHNAKEPAARLQLSRRLLQEAEAAADASEAFVLLNRSAELAAEGGDPELLFRAVDKIGSRYQVDQNVLGTKLFSRYAALVTTPSDLNVYVSVCKRRIDDDLAAGRYKSALDSTKMIYQATLKMQNTDLSKQLLPVQQAVTKLHKEHQAYLKAAEKLSRSPDDSPANLVVGRWYCFRKNNYAKGLPLLAKSGAGSLAANARKDAQLSSQAGTPKPKEQAALGDAWWKLAEKAKAADAVGLRSRSIYWYAQAKTALAGTSKAAVEKRLELFGHLVDAPNAADSLEGLLRYSGGGKATSTKPIKRVPIRWQAIVRCDDEYEIFVNGKRVRGGRMHRRSDKIDFKMSRGDIITVCCKNQGGVRGFCCVLRSEANHLYASSTAWRSYTPADESQWYDPEQIGQTVSSLLGNSGQAAKLQKETGMVVQEIWGYGEPCYLTFQVP